MKIQPTEWEKIFANDVTDKGLISKLYKQLVQLSNNNNKKPNRKMGRSIVLRLLPPRVPRDSSGGVGGGRLSWEEDKGREADSWGSGTPLSLLPLLLLFYLVVLCKI